MVVSFDYDVETRKMAVSLSRPLPCPDLPQTRSELRERRREGREG